MSINYTPATRTAKTALTAVTNTPGNNYLPPGKWAAVLLQSCVVNTGLFESKDISDEREGVISVVINKQENALSYKGTGSSVKVSEKFLNRTLFYGRPGNEVFLHLRVIEEDEEVREALGKVIEVIDYLGGTPAGGIHPAAAPSFKLASSVLGMIKSRIKDDEECVAFLHIAGGLPLGDWSVSIKAAGAGGLTIPPLLDLHMKTIELETPGEEAQKISLRINRLNVALQNPENVQTKLSIREKTRLRTTSKRGAHVRIRMEHGMLESASTLQGHLKSMPNLNVEASLGSSYQSFTTRISDPHKRMVLEKAELFREDAHKPEAGHPWYLPLSLEIYQSSDEIRAEELNELFNKSMALAKATGLSGQHLATLEKASPSVFGFLAEHINTTFSLYSFQGFACLLPDTHPLPTQPQKGLLHFKKQGNIWKLAGPDQSAKKLEWRGQNAGSIELELEISE